MIDPLMTIYLEYISTVLPYKFIYEYEDGSVRILKFKEQDIIHQLGLDRLNKYKIMKDKKIPGVASMALDHLKKSKITIDMIHKDNDKSIILNKVEEYRFITALLGDTKTEHYKFDYMKVPCNIPANYLLYDSQKNTHFHFGSVIDNGYDVSPMTWFIENDRPDKYIKDQERLYLKKIAIEKR